MGYIYIVQSNLETGVCKVGITDDLDRRLKEYNNMTGKSKDNIYTYLWTCEVENMRELENDFKREFENERQVKSKEMYFYNEIKFANYVNFIKNHKLFIKEIPIQKPKEKVKIVKEKQKTLTEKGMTFGDKLRESKAKANAIQNDNALSKILEHDEFYTRYEDVEKEVENYKEFFENKVVFCNCDDPYIEEDESKSSAFALYFYKNFKKLKLKKLICTHYSGGVDLFSQGKSGIIYTTDGKKWEKEMPNNFDGSFDSELSIKILKEESDIICTNPPFSRAIEYWKLIIDSGKKFLIISNMTNAINTAYIKYFMNNQVWSGINEVDWYINRNGIEKRAPGHWFTNLSIKKYNSTIKFVSLKNISEKDKKYDDDGILLIDKCNIPNDYKKPIAVSAAPIRQRVLDYGYEIVDEKQYVPYINGKRKFSRVLIQKVKE